MKNIVSLKRKHCRYKPGSVQQCVHCCACHLSNPYVTTRLKHSTLHRSARHLGGQPFWRWFTWTCSPQKAQPADHPTAGGLLHHLLTLATHKAWRLFSSAFLLLSPTASTFRSGASYAARTFLSSRLSAAPATGRGSVSECKGSVNRAKYKIKVQKLLFLFPRCSLPYTKVV